MTAIIMRKGVLHSVAYTPEQARKLNEDGYVFVTYIRFDLSKLAYIRRDGEVKIGELVRAA